MQEQDWVNREQNSACRRTSESPYITRNVRIAFLEFDRAGFGSDYLHIQPGDMLEVVWYSEQGNGWFFARQIKAEPGRNREGWVPEEFLQRKPMQNEHNVEVTNLLNDCRQYQPRGELLSGLECPEGVNHSCIDGQARPSFPSNVESVPPLNNVFDSIDLESLASNPNAPPSAGDDIPVTERETLATSARPVTETEAHPISAIPVTEPETHLSNKVQAIEPEAHPTSAVPVI